MDSSLLRWLVAIAVLAAASFTDIRWRTVPNWLTLAGGAIGLAMTVLTRKPSLLSGVIVPFVAVLLVFGYFGLRGWMGFGDVKLVLALLLVVGWYATLYVLCYGFILAAAGMIGWLAWRGRLALLWRSGKEQRPKVPLAPFLLLGGVVTLARW